MQKAEFLNRFHLRPLPRSTHRYAHPRKVSSAAVLVPLVWHNGSTQIILTRRAQHLKHHAGQVSFPGGKTEEQDENAIATALREANEEIGLAPQSVTVLGQLSDYQTISGFNVTPIVGFIEQLPNFTIDANEVDDVFTVPLNHVLNPDNIIAVPVLNRGQHYLVYFMRYQQYEIWGATAAMLHQLSLQLT